MYIIYLDVLNKTHFPTPVYVYTYHVMYRHSNDTRLRKCGPASVPNPRTTHDRSDNKGFPSLCSFKSGLDIRGA